MYWNGIPFSHIPRAFYTASNGIYAAASALLLLRDPGYPALEAYDNVQRQQSQRQTPSLVSKKVMQVCA